MHTIKCVTICDNAELLNKKVAENSHRRVSATEEASQPPLTRLRAVSQQRPFQTRASASGPARLQSAASAGAKNRMVHGTSSSRMKDSRKQGCPLSPFLACSALHPVLCELNARLMRHAAAQKALGNCGDDGNRSEPAMGLHLDSTGAVAPCTGLGFAARMLQELGAPHGLLVSLGKKKILSNDS